MNHRAGIALLTLALTACGSPRMRIEWSRPALVPLAPGQHLTLLVESDGPPSATNVLDGVIGVTQGQIMNKWVAVQPVRNEFDAQLRRAGHELAPPGHADRILRLRPT